MKKKLLVLIISFIFMNNIYSEKLSKIAVIDLSKIVSAFYTQSRSWRELEAMKQRFENNKKRILNEIEILEQKKLKAQGENNENKAFKYDDEIFKKKNYLDEFKKVTAQQLKQKSEKLLESSEFISEILKEIKYIAESEGYSIVLRSKDPNIMWWSSEVDITDLVIERLKN